MKNGRFSLTKIVHNNKIVFVFSLLVAIIMWFVIAVNYSPEIVRVVENVPVTIELSQAMKDFGLRDYGTAEYTVDVTVTGKRYLVSPRSLTADDISVKAKTSYVDSAGRYTLQLVASGSGNGEDYEINSLSMQFIDVYFDVEKQAEFTVEPNLVYSDKLVPDGYIAGETVLSEKKVKVTGPETEINKITGVKGTVSVPGTITENETYDCVISAETISGEEPKYIAFSTEATGVTATIPVYKLEKMSASIEFINAPAAYVASHPTYSVEPGSAIFGVAENRLADMQGEMTIATVDFSELKPGENKITVSELPPEAGILVDEAVSSFTVTVYLPDTVTASIEIPVENISAENAGVSLLGTKPLAVTVAGSQASIDALTADSIIAVIDADSAAAISDVGRAKVNIQISGFDDCWVCGNYEMSVKK